MADYRSILDRAIAGLTDNTEENRRAIYDKARNALMRQLSSLEPPLSPAEISKQRLQLEEAVRETENRISGTGVLEDAVADALIDDGSNEAPTETIIESSPVEPPQPHQEPEPQPEPEPEPEAEQKPEPVAATPEPQEPVIPDVPTVSVEPEPPTVEAPAVEAASPQVETTPPIVEVFKPIESTKPIPTAAESDTASAPSIEVPDVKGQELVDEAAAALARVDAIRTQTTSPLDELKETMAEDGVPVVEAPDITAPQAGIDDLVADKSGFSAPELDPENQDPAVIAASSKKSGGRGVVWILLLLILVGAGAFGWAQREALGPVVTPLYDQAKQAVSGLVASFSTSDESADTAALSPEASSEEPETSSKAEDRILNTPTEDGQAEQEPEVKLGERVTLPTTENETNVPAATPSPEPEVAATPEPATPAEPAVPVPSPEPSEEQPLFTPPSAGEETAEAPTPAAPTTTTTPASNLFAANAILYEERKESGRPDVSTGNVVWELVPTGSEAIGSVGLPSVRGNTRIQNRDLRVRFEIMRNLDASLPASHLIEMEFTAGPLFSGEAVNNIAGVLMKENEQDNGKQLTGAIVKVSDTVFWIAMSARAADLASNTDALKGQKWFDIPIVFKNGKRAILTLEKGSSGAKALEEAFAAWEAKSQ